MFCLLVVDDEALTREGIVNGLPWEKLNIDRVLQADDGTTAIQAASKCKPDIVLTDVKMPCMDGIEMAKNLRMHYPDCKIIFMSGYSDKEYLMSAIELKAIRYIEKPIIREELRKTLMDAVNACREEEHRKFNEKIAQKKIDMSIPYIKNEAAIQLLNGVEDEALIQEWVELGILEIQPDCSFVTAIIRLIRDSNMPDSLFYELQRELQSNLLSHFNTSTIKVISAFKDDEYLICHIYCKQEWRHLLSEKSLKNTFRQIAEEIRFKRFFILIGKCVNGINRIQESYNTAALTLQKAFYHGYGCIVCHTDDKSQPYLFEEETISRFYSYLAEGNKHSAHYVIRRLSSELVGYGNTMVNYVKDIYYRFMLTLYKHAEKQGVFKFAGKMDKDYLWETFSGFYTLEEVMTYSLKKISDYFECVEELQQGKNSTIQIISYIQKNFMNENLSVKDISDNTFLSPAYLCTYCKQETGKTINQHITECRIEKAKELLSDKRYRISEIAGLVGYGDGNYFAKIFKKYLGVSPTEYRKRLHV